MTKVIRKNLRLKLMCVNRNRLHIVKHKAQYNSVLFLKLDQGIGGWDFIQVEYKMFLAPHVVLQDAFQFLYS